VRLKKAFFGDILRVGGLSAIGTIQTNLTVILVTGAVGLFGADAIAGYGIASRLDYLQIPLLFGLGTAVVTMIGTNIGAQQFVRARRIAWIGGLLALGSTEALGLATALFPHAWLGLFTHEPGVLAAGTLYLRTVAPVYGFSGLGLGLYFASQCAGRVGGPVFAGTLRLAIAAGVGWFAVARLSASLSTLFLLVAASALVYGGITAVAVRRAMPRFQKCESSSYALPKTARGKSLRRGPLCRLQPRSLAVLQTRFGIALVGAAQTRRIRASESARGRCAWCPSLRR